MNALMKNSSRAHIDNGNTENKDYIIENERVNALIQSNSNVQIDNSNMESKLDKENSHVHTNPNEKSFRSIYGSN